jgi:carbon-monoxide dehydrogenase small subunit
MAKLKITITVNHRKQEIDVEPYETLLDVLRNRLGLTGAKPGCRQGECGACTVNLDGKAVLSCLMLAAQANGREVLTIEGLQEGARLHPIQEAFVKKSALQCGYCTPGMIMAGKALLDTNADPSERDVRNSLANNLCRCTGYKVIVDAVLDAARTINTEGQHDGK